VENGQTGILVPPGNVEQLAEKICFLIEHQDVRLAMGEKAISRAKMFTQERVMQQWIELFENLMK
jgi:glycosyltransferase involved in cell wall biosynthesis